MERVEKEDEGFSDTDHEDVVKIKGPMGFFATVTGKQIFPMLLVLLLAGSIAYGLYLHDAKADVRVKEMKDTIFEMSKAIQRSEETQRAMLYVLSLKPEERERLNLAKPKVLKEMEK